MRGWKPSLHPAKPSPDDGLWRTYTRDIQELDNDQLQEVLEALLFKMARREGVTLLHGLPWANMWVPRGDSETSMAYGQVGLEGKGWQIVKPTKWPTSPQQANVGCLLGMLAARLRMGTPRINTFIGDATPGKTEVYFEQWYHEVQCVKDHCPETVVQESIIWLLKGPALDMARYMGPTTSIAHIL